MDARIGIVMREGKEVFYALVDSDYFYGTLEAVEEALGIREPSSPKNVSKAPVKPLKTYSVLMTFEYPSWSTKDGILYEGIVAASKSEAIKRARKQAEDDGHACKNIGKYWFKAMDEE